MNRTILAGLAVIALAGAVAFAAEKKAKEVVVEAKAQKPRGEGADANVKSGPGKNDPTKKVPAPAAKGGEKKRGGACGVIADNYTPWIIQVYIDGDYQGTVAPWGDLDLLAIAGWPTNAYARADFTDGSTITWGPKIFNCEAESVYRWKLNQ